MIALKDYQRRVLDSLRDFLRCVSRGVPLTHAFYNVQLANDRPAMPYIPVIRRRPSSRLSGASCGCPA